jgi:hypothetical protein
MKMKAIEFESQLTNTDRIHIPPDVASQLPAGSNVRVILLLDSGEEENWRELSLQRFAAGYAPEDSVYEKLLDESPSR